MATEAVFQDLAVTIIGRDDSGPYPMVQVRYEATGGTEWVSADAVRVGPGPVIISGEPVPAAHIPAPYNVAGVVFGFEQLLIDRARALETANDTDKLRELTGSDPAAGVTEVYAAMTGRLQGVLTGLLTLLDRLADVPGPCGRYNPHTPHGQCPGTAPEYPSEPVEVIGSEYEQAVTRLEQANARLREAEVNVSEANDEVFAAEQALAATESAPGIPLERYR